MRATLQAAAGDRPGGAIIRHDIPTLAELSMPLDGDGSMA